MVTRRNWKERQPNPFVVLFPEVHAWIRRGAPVRTIWIYLALAALTILFYLPAVWHDFISLGDYDYVRDNAHVANGITFENVLWTFCTGHTGLWHPLTWLSHMRDCQFFGANPDWQHFNNILLHAINVVLLFFILIWFTGERWRSAFVAAIFAFHPLNVESVAWIAERKNLLATCFLLLGLLAYGRFLEERSRRRYILLLSIFVLGLMTSPVIVTFPFLLLLIDYWPFDRLALGWRLRELLLEKIPLFAISIVAAAITFFIEKKAGSLSVFDSVPFATRLTNALLAYARYLGKIVWPANLFIPYRYDETHGGLALSVAGIILVSVTAAVIYFRRKPYLVTGWFWYLGALVPVLGLVQIAPESMADRYAYIPSIGIFVGITWIGAELFSRAPVLKRAIAWVAVLIIIGCIVKTSFQISYWENTETLLRHSLKLDPTNYLALEVLGDEFLRERRIDEARSCLENVVRLAPGRPYARAILATVLYSQDRGAEAAAHYEKALRTILPLLNELRPLDRGQTAVVMNNLAWLRATIPDSKLRNGAEALQLAGQSLALSKQTSSTQLGTLAAAQAENGKFTDAAATARRALKLAETRGQKNLAGTLEKCVTFYEARHSIRQIPKAATSMEKSHLPPQQNFDLDFRLPPLESAQNPGHDAERPQ